MALLALLSLATAVLALPQDDAARRREPLFIPSIYKFGEAATLGAEIHWGTPAQKKGIYTVLDLGSANFWVVGQDAIYNWGSNETFFQGQCNLTAKPFYNYKRSVTATVPVAQQAFFAYGGNSKLVNANSTINDTIGFAARLGAPKFADTQVQTAIFEQLAVYAENCTVPPAALQASILGLAPITASNADFNPGPSFRQNLQAQDKTSGTFSMWMDKSTKANGTFRGTVLLGALPTGSKYKGNLVCLVQNPPPQNQGPVGYYVRPPTIKISNLITGKKSKKLDMSGTSQCLLDSGSTSDFLSVPEAVFESVSGLFVGTSGQVSYNGSCDDITLDASIDYKFNGVSGKNVTVNVPLRNYVRTPSTGSCNLNIIIQPGRCVLAAPFLTSVFIAFNDDRGQVAIAQGGISSGARHGIKGLGPVKTVKRTDGLPCM